MEDGTDGRRRMKRKIKQIVQRGALNFLKLQLKPSTVIARSASGGYSKSGSWA